MEFIHKIRDFVSSGVFRLSHPDAVPTGDEKYQELFPTIPGTKFGQSAAFEIGPLTIYKDKLLGRGSFGAVFLGSIKQTLTDGSISIVEVVVKITGTFNGAPWAFKQEAYAESLVSVDPFCTNHAVCMYGAYKSKMGFEQRRGYNYLIVYEKMDGDLHTLFRKIADAIIDQNLSEEQVLQIALYMGTHIAYDLALIHRGGLYHKDIKPENLMYKVENGLLRIKLGDFGLACGNPKEQPLNDRWTPFKHESPSFLKCRLSGTLSYMPPELAEVFRKVKSGMIPSPDYDLKVYEFMDIYAMVLTFMSCLGFCLLFDPVFDVYMASHEEYYEFITSTRPYETPQIAELMKKYPGFGLLMDYVKEILTVVKSDSYQTSDDTGVRLLLKLGVAAAEVNTRPEDIVGMILPQETKMAKLAAAAAAHHPSSSIIDLVTPIVPPLASPVLSPESSMAEFHPPVEMGFTDSDKTMLQTSGEEPVPPEVQPFTPPSYFPSKGSDDMDIV